MTKNPCREITLYPKKMTGSGIEPGDLVQVDNFIGARQALGYLFDAGGRPLRMIVLNVYHSDALRGEVVEVLAGNKQRPMSSSYLVKCDQLSLGQWR